MDNHGSPDEYELPADMDSGWAVLKRAVTGLVVGVFATAALVVAMVIGG